MILAILKYIERNGNVGKSGESELAVWQGSKRVGEREGAKLVNWRNSEEEMD